MMTTFFSAATHRNSNSIDSSRFIPRFPKAGFEADESVGDQTVSHIPGLQSVTMLLRRMYTGLCTSSGLLHHLALLSHSHSLKKRLRHEAEIVGLQLQRIELVCSLAGITLRREDCTRLDSVLSGLEELTHARRISKDGDVRIARGLIGLASLEVDIIQTVKTWAKDVSYDAIRSLMEQSCLEKFAFIEDMVRLNAHKVPEQRELAVAA